MRELSPEAANHLIKTKPVVIVQWCRPDITLCANQESILDAVQFPFDVVKIDVSKKRSSVKRYMKMYGIAEMLPAVSIFRGGYVQPFRDSQLKSGRGKNNSEKEKIANAIYGNRPDLLNFIEKSIDAYRLLK